MTSIDKIPLWAWVAGVATCAGLPVVALAGMGHISVAFVSQLGTLYAAGLGRAVYRQNLLARGVRVDD